MSLLPFASSFKLKIGSKVSSGTSGSVLFIDSNGLLAQNNAQFFWDNTNNALRVGTGSAANPTYTATTLFNSGIFFPTVAANAFSVVQSAKTSVNGAVTDGQVTLAFSSQLTAGNMIWVAFACYSQNNVASIFSDSSKPTDTLGHTYTGVGAEQTFNTGTSNTEHLRCFYVANISAGSNTITVHLDHTLGASGQVTIVIAELAGIVTSSPLDIANSNLNNTAGTSATTTSTNATTNANDVILAALANTGPTNPATFTRTDSSTDILDETNAASNQVMATSYNVKSATGSYAATWTQDSAKYGAQMGAFKLASGTTYILVGLSTNGSERMRIDQNGLIGIGVTSPASTFHLKAGSATKNTAPLQFNSGTLETTARAGVMEYNGNLYMTQGGIVRYSIGGTLFDHFADVASTSTNGTFDNLYSDTLAANTFNTNGDKVIAEYGGIFVASGTATRDIKVLFAGTTILDTSTLTTATADSWDIRVLIIRESSTVVRCQVSIIASTTVGAQAFNDTTYTRITGLTLSGTNILKIQGAAAGVGAAASDIVAKLGTIIFSPAI